MIIDLKPIIYKFIDIKKDNEVRKFFYSGHKINPEIFEFIKTRKTPIVFTALDINSLENCYLDSPRTFINKNNDSLKSVFPICFGNLSETNIAYYFDYCIFR